MNLNIKCRESFHPFVPSVLPGRVSDYFDLDTSNPCMLLVVLNTDRDGYPRAGELCAVQDGSEAV
jgi:predicted NodU family carbamoyl transferase